MDTEVLDLEEALIADLLSHQANGDEASAYLTEGMAVVVVVGTEAEVVGEAGRLPMSLPRTGD